MSRWELGLILASVVAIAAIATPNLANARYRHAQKRTMGDMRSIATAMESWSIDHRSYPVVSSVAALVPLLEPTYMKVLPREDGWGRPVEVASDGRDYVLSSRGGDGLWAPASMPQLPNGGFVGLSTGELIRGWFR